MGGKCCRKPATVYSPSLTDEDGSKSADNSKSNSVIEVDNMKEEAVELQPSTTQELLNTEGDKEEEEQEEEQEEIRSSVEKEKDEEIRHPLSISGGKILHCILLIIVIN